LIVYSTKTTKNNKNNKNIFYLLLFLLTCVSLELFSLKYKIEILNGKRYIDTSFTNIIIAANQLCNHHHHHQIIRIPNKNL
jgi:hypothetical protein